MYYDVMRVTKVIDKGTEIKYKCCRGGGLNLCPIILYMQCLSEAKNSKSPSTLTLRPCAT